MENKMLRKMCSLLIVMSFLVIVAPTAMSISYKDTKSNDSQYYDYNYYVYDDYTYDAYSNYEYDTYDYEYYKYYGYYSYYNCDYNYYNYVVINFLENLFERFPTLENLIQKLFF